MKPSASYQFIIIASPSGAYYAEGMNPVKIYVEDEYVRATPGGTGYIKCGGNYAASLIGQMKAHDLGYSQVLWLDGVERKYVEEVGSMNCFFKIDGVIRTAPCVGTVLPGITRMSCIELLEKWGYKVDCESRLPIADVIRAGKEGKLEEVFGTGTAAVISPVGELRYEDEVLTINGFHTGACHPAPVRHAHRHPVGHAARRYGLDAGSGITRERNKTNARRAFLARRAAALQGKPRTKSPFPCNTFFLCYNTHATGAFIKS